MPIELRGSYFISISVGPFSDFIGHNDLSYLSIEENAGNSLPVFRMSFLTSIDNILSYLNEGNSLNISIGQDQTNPIDIELVPTRIQKVKSGRNRLSISLEGLLKATGFNLNKRVSISDKLSGIEVVKDVASRYFSVDSNLEKSQDNQYWIQPHISDKKYIDSVWIHSYIRDSFISTGITMDGTFRAYDMKAKIKNGPVFNLSNEGDAQNGIQYDNDYSVEINQGLVNWLVGYGQEKLVFSLEDEDYQYVSEESKPILAITNELARKSDIEKRYHENGIQTENTHPLYWTAALRNITNNALFGAVKITLTVRDRYIPFKVLDVVNFKDIGVDFDNPNSAQTSISGLYVISKVIRHIEGKILTTTLELSRESLNELTGDFRVVGDETEDTGLGVNT